MDSRLTAGRKKMAEHERTSGRKGSHDFKWVLIILVIIFLGILGRQEYKIYQINKEAEATRQREEQLQKVQADLEAERKRLYDPKYIEKLAREDHNYVKKDEVPIFIVKDKEQQARDQQQREAEQKQADAEADKGEEGKEAKGRN